MMSLCTSLSVGVRVVRGPNWKWGDQDGGEGHAGTVVEIGGVVSNKDGDSKEVHPPSPRGTVILQWDTGVRTNYRVGHQNAYDLRVLDSAPVSISHSNIICKTCHSNNNKLSTKSKRRSSSTYTNDSSSGRIEESKEPNKCDKTSSSLFISGIRWSCSVCSVTSRNSYDLCTECYMSDKHDVSHPFWRIETTSEAQANADPAAPFHVPEGAILMPTRNGSKKLALRGLFPNCKVVRGQDWNWGDQDGGPGKIGKIVEIHGWDSESERSVATVIWASSNVQNVYRLGHKGKVDLKVAPGHPANSFGTYYPDHLPVLGKPNALAINVDRNAAAPLNVQAYVDQFNVGDMVKIDVELDRLRCLQDGHSGFNPRMSSILGKIGNVHRVTGNGDVRVQYKVPHGASENPANYRWTINPLSLKKVSADELNELQTKMEMVVGRTVKVLQNESLVRSLQPGHGEWIPRMKGILGKTGKVIKVYADGDVRVEMTEHNGIEGGNTLTFNPGCLEIQHTNVANQHGTEGGSKQPPMFSSKNNSCGSPFPALAEVQVDSIVAEAAHGNLDNLEQRFTTCDSELDINVVRACLQAASQHGKTEVVRFLLSKFPSEVNIKYQGKTALHVASHQGHLDVVRFLLQKANASVDTTDDDGDTALHYAAFGRQAAAMEYLLLPSFQANINAVNIKKCSVLHVSVVMQDIQAVEIILRQENVEVNVQDAYGDTPLHEAIVKECDEITDTLCSLAEKSSENIDSKPVSLPDFTIKNKRGFNALHYAALKGNLAATKSIISASSKLNRENNNLIDLKKDDGYTALHLACLNGHKNVAGYLIENNANLEVTDNRGQTVLHSAVHQGQAAIVELLLSTSKNQIIINKEDLEGETPLHLALNREGSPPIEATSETSPIVFDLMEKARENGVKEALVHAVAIAAYLVGQGGNPAAKNKFENTPSDMVTDYDARAFILGFTCTRPAEDAIPPRKQYRNYESCISKNLVSAIPDNNKQNKGPCLQMTAASDEPLITECLICSEMVTPMEFKPCGHKNVCTDCGHRMKKCLICKETIDFKQTSQSATTSSAQGKPPSGAPSPEARGRERDLAERLQDYEDQYVCTICMERPKTVAFLCGHRACTVCVETLRSCHMCRVPIQQKINLY